MRKDTTRPVALWACDPLQPSLLSAQTSRPTARCCTLLVSAHLLRRPRRHGMSLDGLSFSHENLGSAGPGDLRGASRALRGISRCLHNPQIHVGTMALEPQQRSALSNAGQYSYWPVGWNPNIAPRMLLTAFRYLTYQSHSLSAPTHLEWRYPRHSTSYFGCSRVCTSTSNSSTGAKSEMLPALHDNSSPRVLKSIAAATALN